MPRRVWSSQGCLQRLPNVALSLLEEGERRGQGALEAARSNGELNSQGRQLWQTSEQLRSGGLRKEANGLVRTEGTWAATISATSVLVADLV